ncbi:MAG TPA: DPP IV N-terminal domain-containing protein [Gemmatimonadaceae bacterium]|nr:DPP IV N-terminal domain-containing protein [Gemmatimonadaceae bacterium]
MSFTVPVTRLTRGVACAALILLPSAARAQATPNKANWELAEKFSAANLRSKLFTNAVNPRWLGQSDSLCYNWKDHSGSTFFLVVPTNKTKKPLFDQGKLAAQLSEQSHRAHDPQNLPFNQITFSKDRKNFTFNADSSRWEWDIATEMLKRLGPATGAGGGAGRGGRGQGGGGVVQGGEAAAPAADSVSTCGGAGGGRAGGGGGGGGQFGGGRGGDFRNYSPDSSMFAFSREHNLYVVKVSTKDTVQLTRDGVKNYSFGARDTLQERQQQELQQQQQQQDDNQNDDQGGGGGRGGVSRDPRVRANVIWSQDSKAFAVTRMDNRKVGELFLVNNLGNPRPTLMSYTYAMPGETNVGQEELYMFKVGDTKLTPVSIKKWKDQRLFDIHWNGTSEHLRMVRRDRTQRHFELIDFAMPSQTVTQLLKEDIENNSSERQNVRYVKTGGDFIWWSERSGWGHYYLYDNSGKLKRQLTSGAWRAERIVDVDSVKGVLYVAGVGREGTENPYYSHLYRVGLDGTGFALLDAGNATHDSRLSPNKKWIVDNASRIDMVPVATLRDATGKSVMDLETMDVSQIKALGWKAPETFHVKAADGTTDIYGNMWKPFDFDSTKKYPIIANVYPGPQTESVTYPFSPSAVPQQLAQLGFIVIQIGNRGGSPQRSQEYQGFSYYNLRDYALADKKAGIEQLASIHKWIDIDRVGIYGHSGGGFLTAAAMLLPPFNDFFKVGVSESGNHDNNVYNQNWSEQYHGLKVIAAKNNGRTGVVQAGRAAGGPSGQGNDGNGAEGSRVAAVAALLDGSIADGDTTNAFMIKVPTTVDLAANLKGNLLLETGDMDNNVHPANTIRLVNALIKANKRFDFMILPGKPHGYGDMVPYTNRLMFEYFAEHLLGDYYRKDATYDHK